MPENLWERAKTALQDAYAECEYTTARDIKALLVEMERVECVEGKADPSGGFWQNTNFPSDRPALLLLLPEEPR